MKIEYNLDLDDYINFNLIHMRNSPAVKRQRILIRLLISIGLTLILFIITLSSNDISMAEKIIAPIIGGGAYFLVSPLLSGLGLRQQVKKMITEGKNEGLIGKNIVAISSEAITGENAAGEGKYFWNALDKLVVSPNYLFLYVGAVKAILIPRNSFNDEQQCDDFIDLIDQYYSEATGDSLPRFTWK